MYVYWGFVLVKTKIIKQNILNSENTHSCMKMTKNRQQNLIFNVERKEEIHARFMCFYLVNFTCLGFCLKHINKLFPMNVQLKPLR